jgi:hypothetical protein
MIVSVFCMVDLALWVSRKVRQLPYSQRTAELPQGIAVLFLGLQMTIGLFNCIADTGASGDLCAFFDQQISNEASPTLAVPAIYKIAVLAKGDLSQSFFGKPIAD